MLPLSQWRFPVGLLDVAGITYILANFVMYVNAFA
jgi:hypothetical protein